MNLKKEELTDVLGWLLFSPTLTFQVVSSFQTTEMDQFTAYRVFVVVRAWSVACNVPPASSLTDVVGRR